MPRATYSRGATVVPVWQRPIWAAARYAGPRQTAGPGRPHHPAQLPGQLLGQPEVLGAAEPHAGRHDHLGVRERRASLLARRFPAGHHRGDRVWPEVDRHLFDLRAASTAGTGSNAPGRNRPTRRSPRQPTSTSVESENANRQAVSCPSRSFQVYQVPGRGLRPRPGRRPAATSAASTEVESSTVSWRAIEHHPLEDIGRGAVGGAGPAPRPEPEMDPGPHRASAGFGGQPVELLPASQHRRHRSLRQAGRSGQDPRATAEHAAAGVLQEDQGLHTSCRSARKATIASPPRAWCLTRAAGASRW